MLCSHQLFSAPRYLAAFCTVSHLGFFFHQLKCFYSDELHTIRAGINNFFYHLLSTDSLSLVQIKEAVCLRSLPDVSESQICLC